MQEEPELTWQHVIIFLQDEFENGEKKGYPQTLVKMIGIVVRSIEIIINLVEHLHDPENRGHKVCVQCGKEFFHTSQFVKTCSQVCQYKWVKDPEGYLKGDGNSRSMIMLMHNAEHQEKA